MLVMPPLAKDPGEGHMNMQMCNVDQVPVMYESHEGWCGADHDASQWGGQSQQDHSMMMMIPQDPSQYYGMTMPTEYWNMTDQQNVLQDMSTGWTAPMLPSPHQFGVDVDQLPKVVAPTLLQLKKKKGFQNAKLYKETPASPQPAVVAPPASPQAAVFAPVLVPIATPVVVPPPFVVLPPTVVQPPSVVKPPVVPQKSRGFQNKKLGQGASGVTQVQEVADEPLVSMSVLQSETSAGMFDLTSMLRFRHLCLDPCTEHKIIGSAPRLNATLTSPKNQRREVANFKQQDNGKLAASSKAKRQDDTPLLRSENAYKRQTPTTREAELARSVTGLLNKICPENQQVIVEQLAQVVLENADELAQVIEIIFAKALDEPHYCKTYADMVNALKTRYPEFPPLESDEKPLTFVRVLLNTCQHEFERLLTTLAPFEDENVAPEDIPAYKAKKKARALANMKFIGHLFLQKLLVAKVMYTVVYDLLNPADGGFPEEHMVECVCELFHSIGYLLASTRPGEEFIARNLQRLENLKYAKNSDASAILSKRIQFLIQDLLDLRDNDWTKKEKREQAKTMDDIKKEASTEAYVDAAKGGARRRAPASSRHMRA